MTKRINYFSAQEIETILYEETGCSFEEAEILSEFLENKNFYKLQEIARGIKILVDQATLYYATRGKEKRIFKKLLRKKVLK